MATADTITLGPAIPTQERTLRSLVWRQFRRHHMSMLGAAVLLVLILWPLFVPVLSPYDPETSSMRERHDPPSLTHPMGTDTLGRDILTRLLYGGRISLTIGLLATALGIAIGTLVGALAGYY